MDEHAINERESEAIRRRLVVIRKYAALDNQAEFARILGIKPTRWNNFENGFPLTLRVAFLIIKTIEGITFEYILEGNADRMRATLKRRLEALEEETFPPKSGRSPSKRS